MQHGEVLRGHHAASSRNNKLGAGDIYRALAVRIAYDLDDLGEDALFGNGERITDNYTLCTRPVFRHRHDIGSYGGHLWAKFVAHDGCHDVPAKSRAGLHQVALVVDGKTGAVSGQTGGNTGSNSSGQVTPHAGSPHQDDLRLVFFDQVATPLNIGLGTVMLVDRGIEEISFGGSVGKGFLAEMLDVLTDHERTELYTQGACQSGPNPQQFPGHLGRLTFGLFDKDPDAAVSGQFCGDGGGFRVDLLNDRSGAGGQLFEDLLFLGGEEHLKCGCRADLDTLLATDAFAGVDNRFAAVGHFDAINRADALAAGAAGDAGAGDQLGDAARLLGFWLWITHNGNISFAISFSISSAAVPAGSA